MKPPQAGGNASPLWYVGVALSVLVIGWYPFLGVMLLAGVTRILVDRSGPRAFVGAVLVAIATVVILSVTFGLSSGLVAVPPLLTTLLLVACMCRGAAGVTSVSTVVAVGTLASLAIDAFTLSGQGYSVADVTCGLLMETVRASAGNGIDANMVVATVEPVVTALWPLVYVMTVMVNVLGAGVGALVAAPRVNGVRHLPQIARFDAPLWSVGVLALSVLGLGASFAGIPYANVVLTVSATVLMSVRFIFAAQGLGVLSDKLSRLRMGCMLRPLIICFAVWVEAMSFILSIVGLIDVWANFRKLPRGGTDAETHR
ncbi:DUF2232 domain-containing protein [Collinsella sp. An2]|uniref:DUF2232 domain-containing protein n=1 Tax=Collinsella sp. An2 TaxID=1965585 RepID=UPI0013026C51|nr:DUF2232 domain-containing protein [Collinsella sp. An2]